MKAHRYSHDWVALTGGQTGRSQVLQQPLSHTGGSFDWFSKKSVLLML